MQINSNTSGLLFYEFQRINREQWKNCPRRLKYATGELTPTPPKQMGWTSVTVFQDSNVQIIVVCRNDPNSANAGRLPYVTLICLHTLRGVRISDRELADKLYDKFMQTAETMANNNELNCTAEDFTDARRVNIKLFIFEWLFAILYGVGGEDSQTQSPTQQSLNNVIADEVIGSEMKDLIAEFLEKSGLQVTCRELLNSIVDMALKPASQTNPDNTIFSDNESSQTKPGHPETLNKTTAKAYADNLWANLDDC